MRLLVILLLTGGLSTARSADRPMTGTRDRTPLVTVPDTVAPYGEQLPLGSHARTLNE